VLEGLEVDQYIWGIVQSLSNAPYDDVTIDTAANWKPAAALGVANDQQDLGLLRSVSHGNDKKHQKNKNNKWSK